MARLTLGQKATRLLQFLMGVRHPRVAAQLAPYGFDQSTLDEGWALLRNVTGDRLGGAPAASLSDNLILRLDAWENLWFPITSAVLRRHHPQFHDVVFRNLTQTEGAEVVLSVSTFVARMDELAATPDGAPVVATLQRHGLREAVLSEARAMLTQAGQLRTSAEASMLSSSDMAVREQAMWDYYLQWSVIARQAVSERMLLKGLGFLRTRRDSGSAPGAEEGEEGNDSDIEEDDVDIEDDDVTDEDDVEPDTTSAGDADLPA